MKRNSFRMSCLAVVAVLVLASACKGATDGLPVRNTGHYAIIETERGTIVLELYPESAPKTVANFETLVNKGFYNGLTWHRVVPDFVIQGGDPDGTGAGGPGYTVPAEIKEKHLRGSLATARTGRRSQSDTRVERQPVLHLPRAAAGTRWSIHRLRRRD